MRNYWVAIAAIIIVFIIAFLLLFTNSKDSGVFKLGVILPLTGDAALYGEKAQNGIELAVKTINKEGGVRGNTIKLIYEDSRADPKTGIAAIQKLIEFDKVKAIIGPLTSTVTLAVAPIAERNSVVLLSPTASAPKITHSGDYIFRNISSDVFEGRIMAEAAINRLNISSTAILYINNDYGVGLKDVFESEFKDLGGDILMIESFPQGANDFRTQLTKIKAEKPAAVYIVGYKELGLLLKQAYDLGIDAQFLSIGLFEDPDILRVAGKAAENVIYSARAYDPESKNTAIRTFVENYKEEYGDMPDTFAAYSYDAVRILALAIQRGGFTPDEIKNTLYSIKEYPGVVGQTSFDENGDVVQPAYLKQVQNGQFVWLDENKEIPGN